jgi:hypothetical protein
MSAFDPKRTSAIHLSGGAQSNTSKSTSLGTVLKADTIRAFGSRLASSSEPDHARPMMSAVSSRFIGSEQLTITLPDRSPA